MPSYQTIDELKLPSELQKDLDAALCERVRETVAACKDRDDDLKSLRMQLEGWSLPTENLPWPGACTLQDTISRELHLTTTAAMWQAAKQTPYVCLEAVDREDVDDASDKETWLSIKAQQFGYENALYDAIYLANEGRYSVMYTAPKQAIKRAFERNKLDPNDEDSPEQLMLREEATEDIVEFRTPDPWDWYVSPITARGPQLDEGCLLCIERMMLNREDLSMGVLTEGYISDKVQEMFEKGPSILDISTPTDEENDRDGISPSSQTNPSETGEWECFFVFGRSPLLLDDDMEPRIPEAMLNADCMWMVCPALGIVFKQCYASDMPEGLRPYSVYNVVAKPGRILGEGTVSLLSDVDAEMVSIVRFGINNMNLEASPMMSVAESWLSRYGKWSAAPGRFMPRQSSDPVGPKPITWDVRSQSLIMPWLQYLDSKAGRLVASQSVNAAMAGKTRKAAEIHFAEQMQQTKFDLFLANIQRGVQQTFRILAAILVQKLGELGDTVTDPQGRQVLVTPSMLKSKFRFLPQASSDTMSPAQRLARQQTITQIVIQYWQGLPQYMQMGATAYWYALNHRLLVLSGERSPERFIGPEPQEQQQQGMQGMMPMMPGMPGMAGPAAPGFPGADEGGGMVQASPFSNHPTNGAMALNGAAS